MDKSILFMLLASGVAPLLLNILFTPLLLHIAHRHNWYDPVDHRKIHSGNIPRIGGGGVFLASFMTAIIIASLPWSAQFFPNLSTTTVFPLFSALLLIHIVGLLDDVANLRPLYKLYGQLIAALILVASGTFFTALAVPFFHAPLELGWFGPVLTVLWLVGVTNAVNLIDGIDGLSSMCAIIAALFLGFCGLSVGAPGFSGISFTVAGAAGAFFLFNFPPAKLFMGDAGSLYLGFFLALLPLYIFSSPEHEGHALPVGMSLLLIPILDTIAAIVRRRRQRKPFHIPDKEHLHHKLLNFSFSNRQILALMGVAALLPSVSVYLWIRTGLHLLGLLTFLLWAIGIAGFLIIDQLHRKLDSSTR